MRRGLVVASAVFAFMLSAVPAARAAGNGSLLAMPCKGWRNLCVVTLDGAVTEITPRAANSSDRIIGPRWSPDGSRIAFMTAQFNAGPWPDIYTIRPDGTGMTQLTATACGVSGAPLWSPDGKRLLFLSRPTCDDPWQPTFLNLTTGQTSPLVATNGESLANRFFPGDWGSNWLIVGDYRDDPNSVSSWRVRTIKADGSNLLDVPIPLQPSAWVFYQPTWGPANTVMFTASTLKAGQTSPTDDIYTIRRDGTNLRLRTSGYNAHERNGRMSPDGTQMTFTRWGGTFVRPMGAGTPILVTPQSDFTSDWQPTTG